MKLKFKWLIKNFGLKGSWSWACRQMERGHVLRPQSATGTIKFKLDEHNQRLIMYTFEKTISEKTIWENANIFLSDFEAVDWVIVNK